MYTFNASSSHNDIIVNVYILITDILKLVFVYLPTTLPKWQLLSGSGREGIMKVKTAFTKELYG
jgi:hypothetical protein